MADFSLSIGGGDKLQATLEKLARRLGSGGVVNVGFLEGATYPQKAQSILDSKKRLSKKKRAQLTDIAASTDAPNVATVAYWNEFGTSRAPPRPFFRQMIAANSPNWGRALGAAVKKADYDSQQTLGIMGDVIKGELRESITQFTTPAIAQSTAKRKGSDKPLVEHGIMLASVDSEVRAS